MNGNEGKIDKLVRDIFSSEDAKEIVSNVNLLKDCIRVACIDKVNKMDDKINEMNIDRDHIISLING